MVDQSYVDRLVDRDALSNYLEAELGPAEKFTFERHDEGHSNETLFLTWGEKDLVIRRPPPGKTADTAHDVLREYLVVSALNDTSVPVPTPIDSCTNQDIIGSDFYIMERQHGDVLRSCEPDRFQNPDAREQIGYELIDGLAAVHAVDYEAVGLEEFGRPSGYTERQVDRWTKQLEWAFETTQSYRDVPELREIGSWLADNIPPEHETTLVHGDYKLDNVMYSQEQQPTVVAIFDWELSTLGDPLADLGWLLLFWRDRGDPEPALPELMPTFTTNEGYPSRNDLICHYEAISGRQFTNERFYRVLAAYKMAALGEMFFARHINGDSADSLYPKMESQVPQLASQTLSYLSKSNDNL